MDTLTMLITSDQNNINSKNEYSGVEKLIIGNGQRCKIPIL